MNINARKYYAMAKRNLEEARALSARAGGNSELIIALCEESIAAIKLAQAWQEVPD